MSARQQLGAAGSDRLAIPFWSSRPAAWRDRVAERATEVAASLDVWASSYPPIRRVRIGPLALSVTAAAPFCSVLALVATARVSLWVFALDDLVDEGRLPPPELGRRLAMYRSATRSESADQRDALAAALAQVRREMARFPLFRAVQGDWESALIGTIDGMAREEEWRRRWQDDHAAFPTYAEYVANGRYSIGGPPHVWSALIAVGDPSIPMHRGHLAEMERLASTGIRLANDLRSFEKEIREGKLNSVILRRAALRRVGCDEARAFEIAVASVRDEITRGLTRLAALGEERRTATGLPETAVVDIARFVCEFYASHDYHTFDTERDAAGADVPSAPAAS